MPNSKFIRRKPPNSSPKRKPKKSASSQLGRKPNTSLKRKPKKGSIKRRPSISFKKYSNGKKQRSQRRKKYCSVMELVPQINTDAELIRKINIFARYISINKKVQKSMLNEYKHTNCARFKYYVDKELEKTVRPFTNVTIRLRLERGPIDYYVRNYGPIEYWDTSNVTDVSYLIKNDNFDKDISKWDTRKVGDISTLFGTSPINSSKNYFELFMGKESLNNLTKTQFFNSPYNNSFSQ